MKGKILATVMALGMVLMSFSMLVAAGTPETVVARIGNAADGTFGANPAATPNGIMYAWETAEAFVPTTTVATFGVNSKGIPVDGVGAWANVGYTQGSGDAGSIWDTPKGLDNWLSDSPYDITHQDIYAAIITHNHPDHTGLQPRRSFCLPS